MKRRQALKISSIGAIGITASIGASATKNNYSFDHGVASGDPLEDRVILWTRLSPNKSGPHEVLLEVSNKINFSILFSLRNLKFFKIKIINNDAIINVIKSPTIPVSVKISK